MLNSRRLNKVVLLVWVEPYKFLVQCNSFQIQLAKICSISPSGRVYWPTFPMGISAVYTQYIILGLKTGHHLAKYLFKPHWICWASRLLPLCLQHHELPLHNECILHARYASQNRFYFGNLDFVFCCHIFGYNKKTKKKCHVSHFANWYIVKCNVYLNHMNDPVQPKFPPC